MKFNRNLFEVKNQNLSEYFPIFNKKGVIIEKTDDGKNDKDCRLILPNGLPLIVNKTGYRILELSDGKLNIKEIIQKLYIEYMVDLDILESDILKIIYWFWKINILLWKKAMNPFIILYSHDNKENNFTYHSLFFAEVNRNIKLTSDSAIFNVFNKKEIQYSPINVRKNMESAFSFSFELRKSEELMCFIIFTPAFTSKPIFTILNYNIEYLYIDNEGCETISETFNDFMEWCLRWIEGEMPSTSIDNRLAVHVKVDKKALDVNKIHNLKQLGFKNVGILQNECGKSEIVIYEKIIELKSKDIIHANGMSSCER